MAQEDKAHYLVVLLGSFSKGPFVGTSNIINLTDSGSPTTWWLAKPPSTLRFVSYSLTTVTDDSPMDLPSSILSLNQQLIQF